MYRNWTISFGSITLLLLLSIYLPMWWLPFIAIAEWYAITSIVHIDRHRPSASCSLVMRMASRTLGISALVMLCVLVLYTDHILPTFIELSAYNQDKPFITDLIVFPVMAVICALMLFAGLSDKRCRDCQRRNGFYAGDSMIATLYYRESRYQLQILMILSLVIGGVDCWYYFARYVNVNFNAPDRFFFCYIPVIVYLLSLIFMRGRYHTIRSIYASFDCAHPNREHKSVLRFMVLCGNDILLHQNPESGRWDTPAESVIGATRNIGDREASLILTEQTGLRDASLRYCYTNEGMATGSRVIHYAAFVDEAMRNGVSQEDRWFNPYMVDHALATNSLAPMLANEIYRIYTITMAWKTYDKEGRRLYPIKNYRPTFRLGDMRKWDVDYDDCTWFDIAANNQDRNFFNLRRISDRITGLFGRKTGRVR